MSGFLRRRQKLSKIRVILIPSSTYYLCNNGCDIHKLAAVLNRAQDSYDFRVPVENPSPDAPRTLKGGLSFAQKRSLSTTTLRPGAIKSTTERETAVDTYIEVADATEQALIWVEKQLAERAADLPLSEDDIIAVVGGDVVVPDLPDNEFEGDVSLDAYSCVAVNGDDYEGLSAKTPEGVNILDFNDKLLTIDRVSFICLRRIPVIFPEIAFTDVPQRAKNIVARYIITNLCAAVGNRVFGVALFHDRITGCLNETNWIGAERES